MLARLRRWRDQRGMTLVEVLVAMTMLSVVLALSTGAVIQALDHNSSLSQQTEAQQRNNVGMEQLTRALRQAVLPRNGTNKTSSIVTTAGASAIQFTTRLSSTATATGSPNAWNTPVTQVGVQLNTTAHTLQWGTGAQNSCTDPTLCTYAAPTFNRTLVYGVRNNLGASACPANTGDGAVFHYWYVDATGNLAPWSPAIPNAPTQTELAKISVVQIDLWTQTQTGPETPKCVALSDYVNLRNWS